MKIPKVISKNGHEYIFVKQNNEKIYLYKDMIYGWNETFTDYDLGLVKEIVKPLKSDLKVEKVKIWGGYRWVNT